MDDKDAFGNPAPADREPRSKVERVVLDYGLAGAGKELEQRWLGENYDRQSLRELADFFNQRVLQAAIEGTGNQTIEGEVANLYRLLTADDVSASARTQAETRLSRMGVNTDSVRQDFVSHQAIHTYLTKVREVSPPDTPSDPADAIDSRRSTIQRLRNRLEAVTDRGIEGLRDAGHVSIGSFEVIVSLTVHCDDCGTTLDVVDFLDQRECDCRIDG